MTRVDETWHRLLFWTAGSTASERLAAQVLLDQGFSDLDPTHPRGGSDNGMDGRCTQDGQTWIMAVYFPHGQQKINLIRRKLENDLLGVAKNSAVGLVFVTNQELTRGERKALSVLAKGALKLFHLERMVMVLDQPRMAQIRQQFLGIPTNQSIPKEKMNDSKITIHQNAKIIQNITGDINNFHGGNHVGRRKPK